MDRNYRPCEHAILLAKFFAGFREQIEKDMKRKNEELRQKSKNRIRAAVFGLSVLYCLVILIATSPVSKIFKIFTVPLILSVIIIQGVLLEFMPL